jgi:methionyl-tRNA formyltransferase
MPVLPGPLRVGFAGTPSFAASALEGILAAGFNVVAALTRPDQKQGRGLKLSGSAVAALALARRLTLLQPATLKDDATTEALAGLSVDVLVVAAYGLILPRAILALPRYGCVNIHASLLPRWRGAAPIQRALLEGDAQTGISIMQMDSGLDTGPIIAAHAMRILPRDTTATLTRRLADSGTAAIVETLSGLQRDGRVKSIAQVERGASYARKISRDEATIDWRASALTIDRQVRALDPAPGAVTLLGGAPLKIWSAEPAAGRYGAPGTIVATSQEACIVACGEGALVVREIQRAGGRRLGIRDFVAGNPITAGVRLGAVSPP